MNSHFDASTHFRHEFSQFPGSFVQISPSEQADCAIIFVHGWGGNPFGTWYRFHSLIDEPGPVYDFYQSCDLYFFRYESRAEWVHASTDRFLNFLDALVLEQKPEHFEVDATFVRNLFPELGDEKTILSVLPAKRNYSRVILVGHSEGGVVVRNAILKRYKSRKYRITKPQARKLLLRSQLCLFAPAIAGFRPAGFLGALMKVPGVGQILQAFLNRSAGYQDLANIEFLQNLRVETQRAAKKNPNGAFVAEILWGYHDRIVHPTKYEDDVELFVEKDHISICKPDDEYMFPIQFVAQLASTETEIVLNEGD